MGKAKLTAESGALMGRWITKAIQLSGVSKAEIGRRAQIDRANVSRYATGRQTATLAMLLRLLEACGLEVIELRVKKKRQTC